jgi:hypothetical protein
MAKSVEKPSTGELDGSSVGKGHLHGGSRYKKAVQGFKAFIVIMENGCIKLYPTSQGGLDIK